MLVLLSNKRVAGDATLVILTNVAGLLEDPTRPETLVRHVGVDDFDRAMDLAQGRMRKKLLGAREARRRARGDRSPSGNDEDGGPPRGEAS